MVYKYFFGFVLTHNMLLYCATAAVHGHGVDNNHLERESDGSYRPRDYDHYGDTGHNVEFDHEAILGSVKDAEEFDSLSPEESRKRLAVIIRNMDLNNDKHVDKEELKKWITESFSKLSREEAKERLQEADDNHDESVSWAEYLQMFGVDNEDEITLDDTGDTGMSLHAEKAMWAVADVNNNGELDLNEFQVFTNPEEHEKMHPFLINQTLAERDHNRDGVIDFMEYIGENGQQQDKEWLITEKDKFDHDLDTNGDRILDMAEIHKWIIPSNDEIVLEEVDHLFASADDDHDELLSYEEMLEHHNVFVGSEADSGVLGEHFDDEL